MEVDKVWVQACYSTTSTLRLRPEGNQCSIVYHHFIPLRMDTKVQMYSFFVAGNSCCRDPSYNRYCGGGSGSTGGGG